MQQESSSGIFRFAADENFNRHILNGALLREPRLDIVRAQDAGLAGADDSAILAWAAETGRVVLTHDTATRRGSDLINRAHQLAAEGRSMPGVVVIPMTFSVRAAIEELLLVSACGVQGDLEGIVLRLRRQP